MHIPRLSPVVHKTIWGLHRVPLRISNDCYQLYVGDHYVRTFEQATLPDEIKVKLAMIHAIPTEKLLKESDLRHSNYLVYENTQYPTLDDIGWQVTNELYCLVLKTDYLKTLRGEK